MDFKRAMEARRLVSENPDGFTGPSVSFPTVKGGAAIALSKRVLTVLGGPARCTIEFASEGRMVIKPVPQGNGGFRISNQQRLSGLPAKHVSAMLGGSEPKRKRWWWDWAHGAVVVEFTEDWDPEPLDEVYMSRRLATLKAEQVTRHRHARHVAVQLQGNNAFAVEHYLRDLDAALSTNLLEVTKAGENTRAGYAASIRGQDCGTGSGGSDPVDQGVCAAGAIGNREV